MILHRIGGVYPAVGAKFSTGDADASSAVFGPLKRIGCVETTRPASSSKKSLLLIFFHFFPPRGIGNNSPALHINC